MFTIKKEDGCEEPLKPSFFNFTKIKTLQLKFMKIWSSIKLPWGHEKSHIKCVSDRFSRFDVYCIQTGRQTDK